MLTSDNIARSWYKDEPSAASGSHDMAEMAVDNTDDNDDTNRQTHMQTENLQPECNLEPAGNTEYNFANENIEHETIMKEVAQFYLKLQVKHLIPSTTIQKIIEEMDEMHCINRDYMMSHLKGQLEEAGLSHDKSREIISSLEGNDIINRLHNKELKTVKSRNKFYKEMGDMVKPVEILLGYDGNGKPLTCQYVPIIETLKSLYIHQRDSLSFDHKSGEGILTDVQDGTSYHKTADSQFSIILYEDSFEVANPLGSAKNKHKLSGVYMTLANFPPQLRSSVDHIQLVMLCNDNTSKKLGLSKVYSRLVDDLKVIENEGVEVSHGQFIKGTLVCITGDNLGSHVLGGFAVNFSNGKYFCRYCEISREEFKENPYFLGTKRTIQNYKQRIEVIEETAVVEDHGIKQDSPFNQLSNFHVCKPGLPPCLAHDVREMDGASNVPDEFPVHPCMLAYGDCLLSGHRFEVVVEHHVVAHTTSFLEGLCCLLASFYVFNLKYPAEASATLDFMQRFLLKINPEKGTKTTPKKAKKISGTHPRVLTLMQQMTDFEWTE